MRKDHKEIYETYFNGNRGDAVERMKTVEIAPFLEEVAEQEGESEALEIALSYFRLTAR